MTARDEPARRRSRLDAVPGPLAIVALLLFCWPLARHPPLTLTQAWAHLFATWALVVVALFALARAAGNGRDREPRRRPDGG